jgi:hypothetical protein
VLVEDMVSYVWFVFFHSFVWKQTIVAPFKNPTFVLKFHFAVFCFVFHIMQKDLKFCFKLSIMTTESCLDGIKQSLGLLDFLYISLSLSLVVSCRVYQNGQSSERPQEGSEYCCWVEVGSQQAHVRNATIVGLARYLYWHNNQFWRSKRRRQHGGADIVACPLETQWIAYAHHHGSLKTLINPIQKQFGQRTTGHIVATFCMPWRIAVVLLF